MTTPAQDCKNFSERQFSKNENTFAVTILFYLLRNLLAPSIHICSSLSNLSLFILLSKRTTTRRDDISCHEIDAAGAALACIHDNFIYDNEAITRRKYQIREQSTISFVLVIRHDIGEQLTVRLFGQPINNSSEKNPTSSCKT